MTRVKRDDVIFSDGNFSLSFMAIDLNDCNENFKHTFNFLVNNSFFTHLIYD